MKVTACLVTRGNVDMQPIFDSLPSDWEVLLWNNGRPGLARRVLRHTVAEIVGLNVSDLSVYGRYAAIEHATGDTIYVQDDDVVVSDPQAIVDEWLRLYDDEIAPYEEFVVCNMPPEFRHDFYTDHALVGFGAAFHRDAPQRAFERLSTVTPTLGISNYGWWLPGFEGNDHFLNTCDVAFTALTRRVLVDIPKENRPFASEPGRMWKQPSHAGERKQMLDLALKVFNA